MIDLGIVKPGSTIRIPWGSYDGATGASEAASNYADADLLIYKDGSTTQTAGGSCGGTATTSFDSGDGLVGINLATINLADNTTAGWWAAGSEYIVIIGPVTVDGQTVYFPAARFKIGYAAALLNTTIATLATQTSFTLTAGPAEDDALNGMWCILHDVASAVQQGIGIVLDYTGASKTVTLVAGTTYTAAATDNISFMGPSPLQPTTSGNKLDVSSGGEAGIDFANIGSPTTPVNLSGTTIKTATDVETDTAEIGAAGAGLTAVPWNAAWDAEVQSEVDDALVVQRLDELLNADSDIDGAAPPTVGSVFHELMSKTAGSFTFDQTTDSNEAIRDKATDIETDTQDLQARVPAALVGGRIDATVDGTGMESGAIEAILKYDLNGITGEAARSLLNALRLLRNKWTISGGTLTVYKEDDTTSAWTAATTTAAGNPIDSVDPA